MKPFRAPQEAVGPLDPMAAATLAATASDLALVLDRDGVILDLAVQTADLANEIENSGQWLGRPWSDTVAPEGRPKVDRILAEAARDGASLKLIY